MQNLYGGCFGEMRVIQLIIMSSNIFFHSSTTCFPTSLKGHPKRRDVQVRSTVTCAYVRVDEATLTSCLASGVHRTQMVEAFICGPWIVVTFRHHFVKVNNAYVRFIAHKGSWASQSPSLVSI